MKQPFRQDLKEGALRVAAAYESLVIDELLRQHALIRINGADRASAAAVLFLKEIDFAVAAQDQFAFPLAVRDRADQLTFQVVNTDRVAAVQIDVSVAVLNASRVTVLRHFQPELLLRLSIIGIELHVEKPSVAVPLIFLKPKAFFSLG